MSVSKRDILILVGFVGVLAAVLSYLLVYKPTNEKIVNITAENEALDTKVRDLQRLMENKDTYEQQTAAMLQEIQTVYQYFPVDVREEDSIMLGINQILLSPMEMYSISIKLNEMVDFSDKIEENTDHTYEIDEIEQLEDQEGTQDAPEAEVATGADGEPLPYTLFNRQATYNYTVTYDGLKRSIKNLCMQSNRTGIEMVTVAFDAETGLLNGSTVVNMYSVPGQSDKEYVQPDFSSVLLGTDNPFGTINIVTEVPLEADGE